MEQNITPTQAKVSPPTAELNEAITKWEALKQQGWIKPIDYIFMAVLGIIWLSMLIYWIIGYPSVYTMLGVGVFTTTAIQAWSLILHFRTMDFILVTRADINLMPVSAARMALAYFQAGQTPK